MTMDNGEIALGRAIILRAIEDGCGYMGGIGYGDRRRVMDEARAWFDRAAKDYRLICDMADLGPAQVRGHAMKLFAEVDAGRVPAQLQHAEAYTVAQTTEHRRRRGFAAGRERVGAECPST